MYIKKYWQTATEEGNRPKIKDRTRKGYNNGELNHTANNHNKNKERKKAKQKHKRVN